MISLVLYLQCSCMIPEYVGSGIIIISKIVLEKTNGRLSLIRLNASLNITGLINSVMYNIAYLTVR